MTEFLLDTHIWFWYLTGSDRLPTGLRDLLDTPQQVSCLSPISVWEVGMLATRGRIQLYAELRQWVVQARQQFPLRDAPLNLEVALTSREITLPRARHNMLDAKAPARRGMKSARRPSRFTTAVGSKLECTRRAALRKGR
ncbi:MAG TPA: type II toxin-antitoxin system VapC family toxin [Candidatus Entotheonella sp.]